ncbi:MAG TPA: hypothetical protein P5328_02855 [Candidatus Paceibacterota bacterium]|nr:hypothetical protein [Candidatus Paceibacterota bacterium]HRZ34379.1 hypothetical protein [Candidatus Paceibacterota bacterium]
MSTTDKVAEQASGQQVITAVEGEAKPHRHPLLDVNPINFESFTDWLVQWANAKSLVEMLGLLHGLTTYGHWFEESNVISFLLDLADGHDERDTFEDHREARWIGADRQVVSDRQKIAQKAFSILCLKFFRNSVREGGRQPWLWMLGDESLFKKVLWFFRPDRIWRLRNCNSLAHGSDDPAEKHQNEILRCFLEELAHQGWTFRSLGEYGISDADRQIEQRLVATRPQFIDILKELRKLPWLLKQEELDPQSLKKLEEMAMSESVSLPLDCAGTGSNYRKPVNLREAVLGGSVAAQVLLLYKVMEKERQRILARYEKSEAERSERQRLAELAELEKERRELEQRESELRSAKSS